MLCSSDALALKKQSQQLRVALRPAVCNTQLELSGRAMNSVACTMACAQEFDGARAKRTRVACASKQVFPGTACTDCTRSLTPAQTHAIVCAWLLHTDQQSASATYSLTPTVLPDWQQLHPRLVAQSCIAVAHAPSGVRIEHHTIFAQSLYIVPTATHN